MSNREGAPIWYELITGDPGAAERFYSEVLGWGFDTPPGGLEHGYRVFSAPDGESVGGLMKSHDPAMKPVWLGYFGVGDVDAAANKVKALGGKIDKPPTDIPDVGRFAVVADPQGVHFYLMRGESDRPSTAFKPMAAGHCGWNELATTDQAAAFDFYGKLFGWARGDAMPMGEMGDYVFLRHAGETIGAIMTQQKGAPPMWKFYFRVEDIEAAAARIRKSGGTLMHGPAEVPGGDHIIIGSDPQGAIFALVGPKNR